MKKNNKQVKYSVFTSVTALVLILILAVSFTFSWSEGGDKGYLDGNQLVISTGSNLTMRQDGKTTNAITIPTRTLYETSSADGRNYFFPLAGNKTNLTDEMTFREGTPQDVNQRYLSLDFELEAGDSATDVYLGAGTIIQCSNVAVINALRMSFNTNDGKDPIVFKPNQMPNIAEGVKYSPITAITEDGVPTTTEVDTFGYGDYYYKGTTEDNSLFHLEKGEIKKITLSIWLEGTEFGDAINDEITNDNFLKDSDFSVYIDFTTTVDDLIKYTFIDNSHNRDDAKENNWIHNNIVDDNVHYETMMYIYDRTSDRYYALEKQSDTEWVGYIPNSISNFFFRRYSIDIDQWWNEWEPSMVNIPTINNERTFVSICGQKDSDGVNLDGCYGYWKDSKGTFRVYFDNVIGWQNLHCYVWDTNGNAITSSWPGDEIKHAYDQTYYIELNETQNVAGIQFNNGDTTTIYYHHNIAGINNWDDSTYAYVYNSKNEGNVYSEGWPGSQTSDHEYTGQEVFTFKINSGIKNLPEDERKFKTVVNNGNTGAGNQWPESGGFEGNLGKSYLFTYDKKFEEFCSDAEITNSEYFFNGMLLRYKSDGTLEHTIYFNKDGSMIYPVNDPTT